MATLRTRQAKKGLVYLLYWHENGKDNLKSLGAIPKREAERLRKQKELQLALGHKEASPLFKDYAKDYLKWFAVQHPSSFDRVNGIINNYFLDAFEFTNIADITGNDVKEYQLSRFCTDQPPKVETYLKELRTLKAMLNRAVEWEIISKNPIAHVRPPKATDSKPPHFYTSDELTLLYDSSPTKAAQWQFIANTGLRRTEAMQLNIKRDVGKQSLRVISTEEARTKSGKWREIPLFDGAAAALDKIKGNELFPQTKTKQSLSRAFSTDAARARLDGSLHSLRHTFCSHLAMSGKVSLTEIKNWAGHSSITTTQRYQHLVPGINKTESGLLSI